MRDESRYGGQTWVITWTERSEDYIARHGVLPEEVEDAVYTRPRWLARGREGTTLVYAQTSSGRYLPIVVAPAPDGGWNVVTARDLTPSERRSFRRKGQ
ncbi:BrnT family toxin [Cellulomonas sp. JH27-2]|uniref:BrnT family toxin n=1 Tax=Cellulomonas sp. JH27-2 TaxID=2774139 RepID=UPI00177F58E6|nr:BrnT family toxin [Cellulomonas sp. JH27-2]MBD8058022.1 BrnT family toxin [Cellulomonas sp. JH27-2]